MMPVQTDCLHAIIKNVIIPIIKLIIEFIINHIISKNPFETSNIKFCIYPVCTSDNFFELIFSILEKLSITLVLSILWISVAKKSI